MKYRVLLSVMFFLIFSSCDRETIKRYERHSTAMDTYLSVTTYDRNLTQAKADSLIDAAFAEIYRIERLMTDYADTSEVGIINLSAGKDTVEVSPELIDLLRKSIVLSEASDGAFDVSVGALVKAWNFLLTVPEVPSSAKIRMLLRLTGYKKLTIDGRKAYLHTPGMRIDLGAIAKGYAVDIAVELLKRNGVKSAIIDLGGNLGVWWEGTHGVDSSVAEILIRHPRLDGKFFGSIRVGTAGVSTSGDYQRFFFKDGIRYHHIIDPSTGYPAKGVVSVTIIADDATTADALSTLVFVMGREKGMEFIKNSSGVEGIIVWEEDDTLQYDLSPGLVGKFHRSDD